MSNKKNLIVIGIVFLALFASAAWAASQGSSGFISGNPAFEEVKDMPGAMIYRKPGFDTLSYSKVLIDPIEIWVAEDSKYKGLDADESKAIADTLRQILTQELEPDYPVVNEPGAGVLGIRIAITNVHMKKKKRGLLGYTPIGLVVTTAGNLAGMRMELKQATIEAEFIDGGSNEQVAALLHPLEADKKEKLSWETVGQNFEEYAKRIRARLDAWKSKGM